MSEIPCFECHSRFGGHTACCSKYEGRSVRAPLPEPQPEQYDGAVHVFNWARNSEPHHKRMLALKSGQYIRETGRAADASNLAWQTVTEAARSGDVERGLISATDILRAAIMFLEWDGES